MLAIWLKLMLSLLGMFMDLMVTILEITKQSTIIQELELILRRVKEIRSVSQDFMLKLTGLVAFSTMVECSKILITQL